MDKIEEIRAKIGECDDIIIKQLAVRMSHIQEIISYKIGVYLATGITLNAMGVEMAFYQLPTPIASFIGIIVAFAMFKGKFDDKLSVFLHGLWREIS